MHPINVCAFSLPCRADVTGEEDEEVLAELNVKLYVKRGTNDFSSGMKGNVRLLKHNETMQERLGACRAC